MATAATTITFRTARVFIFIVASCEALAPTLRPSGRSDVKTAVLRWQGEISQKPATDTSSFLESQGRAREASETLVHESAGLATPYALLQRRAQTNHALRPRGIASQAHLIDKERRERKRLAQLGRTHSAKVSAKLLARRMETDRARELFKHKQRMAARRNISWTVKDENRQEALGKLMQWLVAHYCSKKCELDLRAFDNITNACKSGCVDGVKRLSEASQAITPGLEHPIAFPTANGTTMEFHASNDKTQYNAMMFAGGVKVNGKTTFVARLCTHNCRVGEKYFDSTIILGELQANGTLVDLHTNGTDVAWQWKHTKEHWVPHNDGFKSKGDYVGPEDPRMDLLLGQRFITLSMNLPTKELDCPFSPVGIRHMFFVPVDDTENYKTCDIRIPEVDKCKLQKNWSPLVPRGSKDVYYVYSIRPLLVLRFKPKSCETNWVPQSQKQVRAKVKSQFGTAPHGGTRYVFAKEAPEGDLFLSISHTPGPDYNPVLIALLVRNATNPEESAEVEMVGISCPINLSKQYAPIVARGDLASDSLFFIATSIVDYDPKADVSTITFQVKDEINYRAEVSGFGNWLEVAYKEFKNGNVFACDQLH